MLDLIHMLHISSINSMAVINATDIVRKWLGKHNAFSLVVSSKNFVVNAKHVQVNITFFVRSTLKRADV